MEVPQDVQSGAESVTGYLGSERERLDEAQRAVSAAMAAGRLREAATGYEEYEAGLLRHLRIEEELLFPVFEARSGIMNGPTSVMRDEHRQVRAALGHMRRGLERGDARAYADGLRFLDSLLPEHDAKEQRILYPTLDRLLRPGERTALVERLRREPR